MRQSIDEDLSRSPSQKTRRARLADAAWLRAQIEALAKSADDNTKEDRKEAKDTRDDVRQAALERAADLSEHFARMLRGVLEGLTPRERLADSLRNAMKEQR